jgi:hypothetical protein
MVEARSELHLHAHLAADAYDQAHNVGRSAARRHEVDESDRARGGVEIRFEHERVAAVPAPGGPNVLDRGDQPAAVPSPPNRAAKGAADSRRGRQSRSIDPAMLTSAPVWVSLRSRSRRSGAASRSTPSRCFAGVDEGVHRRLGRFGFWGDCLAGRQEANDDNRRGVGERCGDEEAEPHRLGEGVAGGGE